MEGATRVVVRLPGWKRLENSTPGDFRKKKGLAQSGEAEATLHFRIMGLFPLNSQSQVSA